MNNVTLYINDTANNINSTSVSFTIDISPPGINITYPTNYFNSSNTGLNINYTILDALLGTDSCWYSNDTYSTNTTIADCLNITTVTWAEGYHNLTIWANDSINNINSSSVNFTIDTTPPYFTAIANQSIYNNVSLNYDIDADDATTNVNCFTVNDTTNFAITCDGVLTNITGLSIQIYYINITINDSANNLNSTIIWINVSSSVLPDTTPPTFDNLRNFTHTVNTTFSNSITATDETAIGTYWLNDTNYFTINSANGLITNSTNLSRIEIHYLNITVNDTSGNKVSGVFYINITSAAPTANVTAIATPSCRYKKYTYYNLKLPWFKQTGCV